MFSESWNYNFNTSYSYVKTYTQCFLDSKNKNEIELFLSQILAKFFEHSLQ